MRVIVLFFYFFFLIIPKPTYAENELSQPSSLVFSPVANPTYNNTPDFSNQFNPIITTTSMSVSYSVAIALRDYMVPWIDKIKNSATKSNYESLKAIISDFLWKYKYFIVCNTLLGTYVTTCVFQISDYYFIHDIDRWSHWKSEYSFEELCAIPQQLLTKDLLIAINRRNYSNDNPIDFNHPLITFISDINEEIYRINRYIKITSMQKRLYLMKIFPTNDAKIKTAEKLLTRAHFIKHLFLSWLAEYNLNNK